MASGIIDLSKAPPPASITTEICIVGSGCGGATAAWRLAETGHEVVVLEEGGDFAGDRITDSEAEMYDQLYMERGARSTKDLSISVQQGRVLGGGAVINACDVVPTPDEVLEFWVRKFGLTDFTPEKMKPYTQRALKDLSARRIEDYELNRANELLRDGAQVLGLHGEAMLHNREVCPGLGRCLVGCPVDAKVDPRHVAIPAAITAGAAFYVRARAVRIDKATDEAKTVTVRTLDEKGYHEAGEFQVRAKVVILAANAVASAQLLLRSGIGNDHVGRHLSLQPQLPLMAHFDEKVEAFRGIPQAYAVTAFEEVDPDVHGLSGFRIEAIMGTPGITASLLPGMGLQAKETMARLPYIAASLLLVPDDPTGRVTLSKSGRPVVQYTQQEDHKRRLREAIKAAARIYLAAGAKFVEAPVAPSLILKSEADLAKVDAVAFEPVTAPLISAHQQGTVRFAPTPKEGAADPEGQVYGTRGIYVFDTSGFPTSSSSHTMAPTIALSHYLSERLLARLA